MIVLAAAGSFAASGVPRASSEKWEKDIAAFEAEDRTNRPPTGSVLFVGSSSIRLWTNLAAMFPEWRTIRRGFGGAHLSDVNDYFDRLVLAYQPAKIVLYGGENDINAGRSPESVFQEFKLFLANVRRKLPDSHVYYLCMKPSPSRWHFWPQIAEGNQLIKNYTRFRSKVTYVDVGKPLLNAEGRPDPAFFLQDALHLNGQGYDLWAREIRGVVKD